MERKSLNDFMKIMKAGLRNSKRAFDKWSKPDFRVSFTKNPILQH